ncbi:hypothetical protein QUA13_07525 [Microcoleus sp. S28C3]
MEGDPLRAIAESKKLIAKNRAGNGINEMHTNLIIISNLIFYLEKLTV